MEEERGNEAERASVARDDRNSGSRAKTRSEEVKKIGDFAKKTLQRRKSTLPVQLNDEVYYPDELGTQFCVACGLQGRFRLDRHLKAKHQLTKETDDEEKAMLYKVDKVAYQQVGRGVLERLKSAYVDLADIPMPQEPREWEIYMGFVHQLRSRGIPIRNDFEHSITQRELRPSVSVQSHDIEVQEAPILPQQEAVAALAHGVDEGRGLPGLAAVDVEMLGEEENRLSPDTAAVDVQAHGQEERAFDQQDMHRRPPTQEAPFIPRHQVCYTTNIAEDSSYTGGTSVHYWFLRAPFKELMFAHEHDNWSRGEGEEESYYTQTFSIPTNSRRGERWMSDVDEQLKLWRKLNRNQHPVLQRYSTYLETRTSIRVRDENGVRELRHEIRQAKKAYASNVERFMLVAMRSRKRIGQTVTIDDAIYSCEIIMEFFRRLQNAGVVVSVRSLFAISLLSFYKYLNLNIGAAAGPSRFAAIDYGIRIVEREVEKARDESKSLKTYDELSEKEKQQTMEAYCVIRKMVDCVQIELHVEEIMRRFNEHNGSLQCSNYNYVMSALMVYLMHCNGARNEVTYKTFYGNINDLKIVRPDPTVVNTSETFWVGRHPRSKNANVVREPMGRAGGYFVVDEKSMKWIEYYKKLREYVCRRNNITGANTRMKAFFIQWNGRDMKEQSSRRLMKQFFKNLRCGAAEITCNTTRRNVAHIENQKSVAIRDRMRVLMNEAANPDLAVLQSHHTWSQRELYVEEYQQCCVFGYLTLRSYANTQARRPEMVERLAEVERMLSRLRNVPERRADAHEARRSTPSPQLQDIAEGDLVDIQEEMDIGEESDAGDADDEISYDDNVGDETADDRHLSEDDDARPSGADVLLPSRTRRKRDSEQAMLSGDDELIDIIRRGDDEDGNVAVEQAESSIGKEHVATEPSTYSGPPLPPQQQQEGGEATEQISAEVAQVESAAPPLEHYSFIKPKRKRGDPLSAVPRVLVQVPTTTTGALETSQQYEEKHRAVLERGAAAAERLKRQSEQQLSMEHLQVRDRYATPLPEIADPDKVLDYMRAFNRRHCDKDMLGFYKGEFEQQRFNLRRLSQPYQDFPWLEIRDIPSIDGKGVFAKTEITKGQIVCDYRGKFVREEEMAVVRQQLDPADVHLVGDYEVEYNVQLTDEQGTNKTHKYNILAHDPIYKGAVTIGRLFNHSRTHANLEIKRLDITYATDIGGQKQLLLLFKARRTIKVGEQLLWDYGRWYAPAHKSMDCLCQKCKPQLVSSTDLRIPVVIPRMATDLSRDEGSYSQQIGLWPRNRDVDLRSVLTSRNVFLSVYIKTRVAGLIPVLDGMATSPYENVTEAYQRNRLMFLGVEDRYPASVVIDVPPHANALLELLCVAYRDAYIEGNPVVLVLKREERKARFGRSKKQGMMMVVLLGSVIRATERKRYGNCILYDDKQKRCQVVIEQTSDKHDQKSMLELYGEARLMRFETANETMWTELRKESNMDVKKVLEIMDKFDPYRLQRQRLRKAARLPT